MNKGFTLVEVLVGLGLFMGVLLCSAQVLIAVIGYNSMASERYSGLRLAHNKIEELRSLKYDHPSLGLTSHSDINNPLNSDETNGGIYTRIWHVTKGKVSGTKRISVEVQWAKGRVALQSVIADID